MAVREDSFLPKGSKNLRANNWSPGYNHGEHLQSGSYATEKSIGGLKAVGAQVGEGVSGAERRRNSGLGSINS